MDNCKFCQAEMEEGNTVCPQCGKDNATPEETAAVTPAEETETAETTAEIAEEAAAAESETKPASGKNTLMIGIIVVLVAVIVGLVIYIVGRKPAEQQNVPGEEIAETVEATIPADGNPEDVTCKGTYTAEEADILAAGETVVARAGDRELTNAQLQVYYWMEVRQFLSNYGGYAAYMGLDTAQSLDTQACGVAEGLTWQQFFLQEALNTWLNYQAMTAEAQEQNVPMDESYEEMLTTIVADLNETAVANGFADGEEMMRANLGVGGNVENYVNFLRDYYQGYSYFLHVQNTFRPTEEILEAYFAEHEAEYIGNGITKDMTFVDVRHILVYPEGATSENIRTETFSEEAWTAGEAKAQAILDQWLAGEKTEDSFAALAEEMTEDPGSKATGGLYTDVAQGQMVAAFDSWCFDPVRQFGDYGIVKTEYGYHVMYFSGSRLAWKDYVESDWLQEQSNTFLEEVVGKYPMTVEFGAIQLAEADLGA